MIIASIAMAIFAVAVAHALFPDHWWIWLVSAIVTFIITAISISCDLVIPLVIMLIVFFAILIVTFFARRK